MTLFVPTNLISHAYRNGRKREVSIGLEKENAKDIISKLYLAAGLETPKRKDADIGSYSVTVGKVMVIQMAKGWVMILPATMHGVVDGDLCLNVSRRTLLDAQYALSLALDNLQMEVTMSK